MYLVLQAALCTILVSAPPQQQKPAEIPKTEPSPADIVKAQRPSYPLRVCPISGEVLGSMGGPLDHVVRGRLVRLCCKGCVEELEQDPAPALAKIDKAVLAEQKAGYPLDVCPVSEDPLGSEAVDYVSGTRLVRFCCPKCVAAFDKDPKPTMARIDAALIEKQRAVYPVDICLVSGEPLSENEPKEYLYGTRLFRLCCKMCIKDLEKDPEKYLAALDAAAAKKSASGKSNSGLKSD